MNKNFYICILAGGSGTRLWPMSRCSRPKQFHNLCSSKSLIQETYERFRTIVPKENIYICLVSDILKTAQEQLKDIPKKNFIIEPVGRNTAPAIGLSAAKIFKKNPDAIMAACPSDHTILKTEKYQKAFLQGVSFVEKNPEYLVTIGIQPTQPETGYGYIQTGDKLPDSSLRKVEKFVEKPDQKTAQKYLKSGKYLWNAGYFIAKVSSLLAMYKTYEPEMSKILEKIIKAIGTKDEEKVIKNEYQKLPAKPIDTALAEKVKNIAVIPADDLGWSDIGSWAALLDLLSSKKDQVVSRGHHIGFDDKNCLVYAQDKLLATVGLEDIIIVDTPDVTLVCHKDKTQDVKHLIEKLKQQGKTKYL